MQHRKILVDLQNSKYFKKHTHNIIEQMKETFRQTDFVISQPLKVDQYNESHAFESEITSETKCYIILIKSASCLNKQQ